MEISTYLRESFETGFIVKEHESSYEYQPQLMVNNKKAKKKILGTILHELGKCEAFYFSVAFLTTSGVAVLVNTLEELQKKGVKGKILVSQYQNFTQPEALKKLKKYKNIELKIVTLGDFHAKGYIFKHKDYYNLIVGSSNLTASALTSNKEWNLRVSGLRDSKIINDSLNEFNEEFDSATAVDDAFIEHYASIYSAQKQFFSKHMQTMEAINHVSILPNPMQQKALSNLSKLRSEMKTKALLISATGTGKTYLSAFDVKSVQPKRMLFLVHRSNIAKQAMESYKRIFANHQMMGIFSGTKKEIEKDFIFSTIQTISRDENLANFEPDHFDYIVIDETHRSGAETYQKILAHFKPKFLLGMTATPERTDGFDIFKQFDYNIAYEIRLQSALEENMLCPFHYYGITDITVENEKLDEDFTFLSLVSEERVNHIINTSRLYGCDDGCTRGLVFCNSNKVSRELSASFNRRGFKTIALSGENNEIEREKAINRLETDNPDEKYDYIFTVDIFNEGIDIPKVNQIIMLRPTQSAIIFIQQLGRGLRKTDQKEYLTVIDFIGNYSNNYLIPIALYGDSSFNKDSIRKLMAGQSDMIPGSSTVNFDRIAKERIFESIDNSKMQLLKDLVNDYKLLKYKIGHMPMMMDFVEHSSRDSFLYVNYSGSFFNFALDQDESFKGVLTQDEIKLLEVLSKEIANSKRIEEVVLLQMLLKQDTVLIETFEKCMHTKYAYTPSKETLESTLHNINLKFTTEKHKNKLVSVSEKYGYQLVNNDLGRVTFSEMMKQAVQNKHFKVFLTDALEYATYVYENQFKEGHFVNGFILYKKYSRKDVFRILNWRENPVAQNVGGYIVSPDKSNCPIFVNYHKAEDISSTTKYEDHFINNGTFAMMSKSNRTLNSPDVQALRNYKSGLRIPLFIKKSNDEGIEFYFMGDLTPIEDSFEQGTMEKEAGKEKGVSVVKIQFIMAQPVENDIYEYILSGIGE